MRHFGRSSAVLVAALAAAVLGAATGCSSSSDDDSSGSGSKNSGRNGKKAAASAARQVGGEGSPCVLPVTFEPAKSWKPKAVEPIPAGQEDHGFNKLLQRGGVRLVCEIDAKPAGNIGFLKVWTGPKSAAGASPRTVLEEYLADEIDELRQTAYRDIKVGDAGLPATEVVYTLYSKLMEETRKQTAVALATPEGPVLFQLGGLDTEEHQEMLPTLELAKKTVRLSTGR
ncbi:lipoprotein [Streptomyces sp. NPDC018031]|uniref:lipoprotein n=1 Tax=Streptomyces sp. NPDC018031 TaxID=3365033 RepID=UPI00379678BB